MLDKVLKYYLNKRGFKTNRKIIVFESDDWGSLRMPNKMAYDYLSETNDKIISDCYSRLDTLASKDDLEALFHILLKYKDQNRNPPKITANTIVANPDFDKIKEDSFETYHYERFDLTISKLSKGNEILELWDQGIEKNIFRPQLHGREHLNAQLWLKELKSGNQELLKAFDVGCFGIPYDPIYSNKRKSVMAALDRYNLMDEEAFQKQYIIDGAHMFQDYFGYSSKTFIPTAYIWSPQNEQVLRTVGVKGIQGLAVQYVPNKNGKKFKKKLHFIGQRNKIGLRYTTRNVFFEPSSNQNFDWLNSALHRIQYAFKYAKPAIVGTHRLNFIGSLVEENRGKNLLQFDELLKRIIKTWPDVEFMSSDELMDLIIATNKHNKY